MFTRLAQWIDRNILSLGREMRLSYLPPLMVYLVVEPARHQIHERTLRGQSGSA